MFTQAQTTQDTKAGTSNSSTKTQEGKAKIEKRHAVDPQALDSFLDAVANQSNLERDYDGLPCIGVPREIIDHHMRGADLANFEKVQFFIYQGVKVFEEGFRPTKPKDGVQP